MCCAAGSFPSPEPHVLFFPNFQSTSSSRPGVRWWLTERFPWSSSLFHGGCLVSVSQTAPPHLVLPGEPPLGPGAVDTAIYCMSQCYVPSGFCVSSHLVPCRLLQRCSRGARAGQSIAAVCSRLPAAAPRVLRGLCLAVAPPSYLLLPLR